MASGGADLARVARLERVRELLGELHDLTLKPVLPRGLTIGDQAEARRQREQFVELGVEVCRALARAARTRCVRTRSVRPLPARAGARPLTAHVALQRTSVHPQQFRRKRQVIVSGVEHARDVPLHDARQPDLAGVKRTEIGER